MYDELRAIAGALCDAPGAMATLQPTALVNEVYLKLAHSLESNEMDRDHLIATAARAMRQVCADYARAMSTQKRGEGWKRVTISGVPSPQSQRSGQSHGEDLAFDIMLLDQLLCELGNYDERQLRVVELRFFGGMTYQEIAHVLEITPKRAELDWRMAKAWLGSKIKEHQSDEP